MEWSKTVEKFAKNLKFKSSYILCEIKRKVKTEKIISIHAKPLLSVENVIYWISCHAKAHAECRWSNEWIDTKRMNKQYLYFWFVKTEKIRDIEKVLWTHTLYIYHTRILLEDYDHCMWPMNESDIYNGHNINNGNNEWITNIIYNVSKIFSIAIDWWVCKMCKTHKNVWPVPSKCYITDNSIQRITNAFLFPCSIYKTVWY